MTLQFSYVAFIISLFKDFELTLSKNFKYKSWKFGSMLALQRHAHNSATEHIFVELNKEKYNCIIVCTFSWPYIAQTKDNIALAKPR
jgi:hypothetical protein